MTTLQKNLLGAKDTGCGWRPNRVSLSTAFRPLFLVKRDIFDGMSASLEKRWPARLIPILGVKLMRFATGTCQEIDRWFAVWGELW